MAYSDSQILKTAHSHVEAYPPISPLAYFYQVLLNFNESPVAMQRYKRRTIANLDLIGHIFYLQNFQLNKKLKKLKKN